MEGALLASSEAACFQLSSSGFKWHKRSPSDAADEDNGGQKRTMLGFKSEGALLVWGVGESRKHDWGGGITVWGRIHLRGTRGRTLGEDTSEVKNEL